MAGPETTTSANIDDQTDVPKKSIWARIDWVTTLFLVLTPIVTAVLMPIYFSHFELTWPIVGLLVFMYLATTMSITGGYHRLFSHRSYQAHWIVRALYSFFGAAAFQGSILKWSTDHRRHHRKVDTDEDPYSIKKGFWYAHIGWLFFKTDDRYAGQFEKDLEKDPMVAWQHRHYVTFAIFAAFGFPTLVGWAMGDAFGGFLFGGFLRVVLAHHATFLINSACHVWGRQPYTDKNSARDSVIMAVLTSGEGYHNFHHMFEGDYRNGVRWYQYDPTKWLVKFLSWIGLTKKLRVIPNSELLKYRLRADQKRLELIGVGQEKLEALRVKVEAAQRRTKELKEEYKSLKANFQSQSKEKLVVVKAEMRIAKIEFNKNLAQWRAYVRTMQSIPQPVPVRNHNY